MSAKPDPATLPCSPLEETDGLKYFPRMLGKIRLHASGKLWEDLHANLGKGSDGSCVGFLHVNYDDLKARVLERNPSLFTGLAFPAIGANLNIQRAAGATTNLPILNVPYASVPRTSNGLLTA